MGCTSSREKDPGSSTEVYQKKKRRCGGDNDDFLTEDQKTLVRETWSLLADDLVSRGSMIFLYIFQKRPSAKELFPFRNVEGDALLRNAMFKGHGKRFMHAVETTVRNLDALDIILVPTLYQLGKRHAYITDIFLDYQVVFKEAIIATFEQELGSACTAEVREAWALLFDFIGNKLLEGYDVGMEERRVAESKQNVVNGIEKETVTPDGEGKVNATAPVCRVNGDVTLPKDAAACPIGQASPIQPPCTLPDDRATNPASVAEKTTTTTTTGDVATTTNDTTTTRSDSMAPLATLDEIPITPTSPKELLTTASMCPWAATDGAGVPSDTPPADVRQSHPTTTGSTCTATEGTNDVDSTQTNDIAPTHPGHQTATCPIVEATTPTATDNCNSSCADVAPTTADSSVQSPRTPTDMKQPNDWSNSVETTPDTVTSSTECPRDCITTTNDITLTTVDHNSNGALQCGVYSGCKGTNVIVDGNDISRLLQANRV